MKSSFIKASDFNSTYGNPPNIRKKFEKPSTEKLQLYKKNAVPENTQKSTMTWANRFKDYINDVQPDFILDTSEDKVVIARLLSEFIIQVKTRNDTEYSSDSLYVGINAINHYLQTTFKHQPVNIHNDFEFKEFREILHSRMKELEQLSLYQGADPLTDDEMRIIFNHPQISRDNPQGLLFRVFLWVGCITARRDGSYYKIKLKDLVSRDDGGFDLITIHDKTHQGGYFHHRRAYDKAKEQAHIIPPDEPNEYGPIADIKLYISKRPPNADEELFLHPLINYSDNIWYSNRHLGRDKLSGFTKEICSITGINCAGRRIVNHSLRKHTAQKLNDTGVDIQAAMSITKHRTVEAYNMYRSQNEQQRVNVAKLIVPPGIQKYNDNDETGESNERDGDSNGDSDNEINHENNEINEDQANSLARNRSRSPFTPLFPQATRDDNAQGFHIDGLNFNFTNCKVKIFLNR